MPGDCSFNEFFQEKDGDLLVGGLALSTVAAKFGTPLFVYDETVLSRKFQLMRESLPEEIEIYYSIKANPNQDILRFFVGKQCGLEVASVGEFHQARVAGCMPDKIVFAGPGKAERELEYVIEAGIGEIHAESLLEVARIGRIAARRAKRVHVALRVNPTGEAEGGAMRMGGRPAPFGVDEEVLDQVLNVTLVTPCINFAGVHLFSGTQVLDYAILIDQYRHALKVAKHIVKETGSPLRTVDFGGGWGIPYFAHEKPLDLPKLKVSLQNLWVSVRPDLDFSGTQFLVEPGRFLVAEAGIYIARINDIKESRGKKFLILDGGMHHHLAASGNLGQTIKRNYPIANASRLNAPPEEVVDVVGPLCTPLDVLGRSVTLPKSEIGDILAVFQSGAYARSASPLGFLSHPSPAEVYVRDGDAQMSRQRGCKEDYLRDQMECIARNV
jgi:diaminopimelate decarboxylase